MCSGSPPDPAGPVRGTVYVVDGDPEVGRSIQLLLRPLDLDVHLFQTAEVALAGILENPPSCIVTEVYLPGMTGIQLQREIRALDLRIPFIVTATHADVPLAVEAMQLGAMDFIEKPIIDRVVLARVREALASSTGPELGPAPRGPGWKCRRAAE